jgi:hypothetical protein
VSEKMVNKINLAEGTIYQKVDEEVDDKVEDTPIL